MTDAVVGVIGGSGLYSMEALEDVEEVTVDTPFGPPSDAYVLGTLGGVRMAFLSRHGRGHRIPPHQINFRANIYGMKKLGAERVISVSAVGSMKEEIAPGHIVVPDQFIDRTKSRIPTFFQDGIVAHVAFADPICGSLAGHLGDAGEAVGATLHRGGTYICMEGPQFSTRAESNLYRTWGVSVIGMTNIPEAKLAREAELCYATLALSTDYDCWHDGHDDVTVDAILEIIRNNVAMAQRIIQDVVGRLGECSCSCRTALATAILTDRAQIPAHVKEDLAVIAGPYLD